MEKVSFWSWMRLVHSSADESSKRVWGAFIIFNIIVVFYMVALGLIPTAIWLLIEAFTNTLLIVGASLIGLDTVKAGITSFRRNDTKDPAPKIEEKKE